MPPGGQQPKWPLPSSPKHSQIEYYEYAPPGAEGEATVLELDGGYGWVCTAAATFIAANTWGVGGVSSAHAFLFLCLGSEELVA